MGEISELKCMLVAYIRRCFEGGLAVVGLGFVGSAQSSTKTLEFYQVESLHI